MSKHVRRPVRPRRSVRRRSNWLRLFALVVALLGVLAQHRALAPKVFPSAPVARLVAERVQSIETHAVRAEPALRVAPAPVLARVPVFPDGRLASPAFFTHADSAPRVVTAACGSIAHFHTLRRIPRMNSEEPPRA